MYLQPGSRFEDIDLNIDARGFGIPFTRLDTAAVFLPGFCIWPAENTSTVLLYERCSHSLPTCPLSSLVLLHILSRAWSKDPPGVAFFFPVACKDKEIWTQFSQCKQSYMKVSIIKQTKCFRHPAMVHQRDLISTALIKARGRSGKGNCTINISSYMIHVLRE